MLTLRQHRLLARHTGESRSPWIPACAGMTMKPHHKFFVWMSFVPFGSETRSPSLSRMVLPSPRASATLRMNMRRISPFLSGGTSCVNTRSGRPASLAIAAAFTGEVCIARGVERGREHLDQLMGKRLMHQHVDAFREAHHVGNPRRVAAHYGGPPAILDAI